LEYNKKMPLVEFNFLLKYLFRCNYDENELEDDNKVIPISFRNPDEYESIFEVIINVILSTYF
jgi:hypothetical protein